MFSGQHLIVFAKKHENIEVYDNKIFKFILTNRFYHFSPHNNQGIIIQVTKKAFYSF